MKHYDDAAQEPIPDAPELPEQGVAPAQEVQPFEVEGVLVWSGEFPDLIQTFGHVDPGPAQFTELVDLAGEPPANLTGGVAHFCRILPGDEPDECGGCGAPWPCEHAVHLQVERVE